MGNTFFCLSPHFSSCLLSHLLLTLLKIGVLVIQARFSSCESRCLWAGGEKVQLCFLLLQQSFAFALNSTRFAFLQMFPKQVLNSGFVLLQTQSSALFAVSVVRSATSAPASNSSLRLLLLLVLLALPLSEEKALLFNCSFLLTK